MKFKPNYKTKDGWFEIELDKSKLIYQTPKEDKYWQSKELTPNKIMVYNTNTQRFSEKSLYLKKGRLYFKGSSSYWNKTPYSKYYIDELEENENDM